MNKKKEEEYGLQISDFKYGIVIGALAVIFWAFINLVETWFPSVEIDLIQSGIYVLLMISGGTVLVDYFIETRRRKK